MATTINQFSIGGKYNSFQLKDLAEDGKYTLRFPSSKNVGSSVATLKKGKKLVASFLLIRTPSKGSVVSVYQRIY